MSEKKKTQSQLLKEIADLLLPMSNLARYQIQKINEQIQAQQALAKEQEVVAEQVDESSE